MGNRTMTIDDVANFYKVSSVTVRRWIKSGKIQGQKIGGQWRFNEDMIKALNTTQSSILSTQENNIPQWAKEILDNWSEFLAKKVEEIKPDHIIVTDRTGAKVWHLIQPQFFDWGKNLWHSTIIELSSKEELTRKFKNKKVILFDEMIQYGREMHNHRLILEQIDAIVYSFVCVRRRSLFESGDTFEYDAIICEDLDDVLFSHRAMELSKLSSLFIPPLDSDHLVVNGQIKTFQGNDQNNIDSTALFLNIANWGVSYVVRYPDEDYPYLTITLDRPNFFDLKGIRSHDDYNVNWQGGPCKIRFYINLSSGECFCSFIVYPTIIWEGKNENDDLYWKQIYSKECWIYSTNMFERFINSGAAASIGIEFSNNSLDESQLQATIGLDKGKEIAEKVYNIINLKSSSERFVSRNIDVKEDLGIEKDHDDFSCRKDLLDLVPRKYKTKTEDEQYVTYYQLINRLSDHPYSTINQVLDYELDWGTVKPFDEIKRVLNDTCICMQRAFCRGEYGAWFEYSSEIHTHEDYLKIRILAFVPSVIEMFLKFTNNNYLTATQFNKIFANLSHDWYKNIDPIYLGWIPYKYGPVPVIPTNSLPGFMEMANFMLQQHLITRNTKGKKHNYTPGNEELIPWHTLYNKHFDSFTRSFIASLLKLYSAIQVKCLSQRLGTPGTTKISYFQDPLVILGAVRNKKTAYRCAWFEYQDWIEKGKTLLILMETNSEIDEQPQKPLLKNNSNEFAAPARLLYDKIEMYRNLPYLRNQIKALENDYEFASMVLENVDIEPIFDKDSEYPMKNLEWACSIMRPFSSFSRQILTLCHLDIDERPDTRKQLPDGTVKDSYYYLKVLLKNCPDLEDLEEELRKSIKKAEEGKLTKDITVILKEAFYQIKDIFQYSGRLPDPRDWATRQIIKKETKDGIIQRISEIQRPDPYGIAILDVRNIRNLPKFGIMVDISYDEMLYKMLRWIDNKAKQICENSEVQFCGVTGDQVIFVSSNCEKLLKIIERFIVDTAAELSSVDNRLFCLFRGGVAWRDTKLGENYMGVKPGILAHEIGDDHGIEAGTIRITHAIIHNLPEDMRKDYKDAGKADTTQGRIYTKKISAGRSFVNEH